MNTIEDLSSLTESPVTQIARGQPHAKRAVEEKRNASPKAGDTVTLSAAARRKHAETAGLEAETGEEGAALAQTIAAPKNTAHAIKAGIAQIAGESGLPRGGWAVGHYKKAFAAMGEDGDLSAMKEIFLGRQKGGAGAVIAPDPVTDPAPVVEPDPVTDPDQLGGGDPGAVADPLAGLDPDLEPDTVPVPDLAANLKPDVAELLSPNQESGEKEASLAA